MRPHLKLPWVVIWEFLISWKFWNQFSNRENWTSNLERIRRSQVSRRWKFIWISSKIWGWESLLSGISLHTFSTILLYIIVIYDIINNNNNKRWYIQYAPTNRFWTGHILLQPSLFFYALFYWLLQPIIVHQPSVVWVAYFVGRTHPPYCAGVYPSSDGRGGRLKSATRVRPQSGH